MDFQELGWHSGRWSETGGGDLERVPSASATCRGTRKDPFEETHSLREGLWVEALPSCVSGDVPGMKIKTDSLSQPQVTVLPPPSDAGFLSQ